MLDSANVVAASMVTTLMAATAGITFVFRDNSFFMIFLLICIERNLSLFISATVFEGAGQNF
jgi:hypothetical protein